MMTRDERANQFGSFDAMKGLQEALKDREERHQRVEKLEISEEMKDANSKVLVRVERGTKVEVYYYRAFHNVTRSGTVKNIDHTFKYLILEDERIWFDDIYSIKVLDY